MRSTQLVALVTIACLLTVAAPGEPTTMPAETGEATTQPAASAPVTTPAAASEPATEPAAIRTPAPTSTPALPTRPPAKR